MVFLLKQPKWLRCLAIWWWSSISGPNLSLSINAGDETIFIYYQDSPLIFIFDFPLSTDSSQAFIFSRMSFKLRINHWNLLSLWLLYPHSFHKPGILQHLIYSVLPIQVRVQVSLWTTGKSPCTRDTVLHQQWLSLHWQPGNECVIHLQNPILPAYFYNHFCSYNGPQVGFQDKV